MAVDLELPAAEPPELRIAAGAMHRAGHVFHRADNGVWLTEQVPPGYISDHS